MTGRDHYADALDQLRAGGLVVDSIEVGVSKRVPVEGDKGKKLSGWYMVHQVTLKSGELAYIGNFQNWKIHDKHQALTFDPKKYSKEEKAEFAKRAAEARQAGDAERAEKSKHAGDRARRMWPRLPEGGASEYLARKRVGAHGVRFAMGGTVVVPVRSAAGELVGLQFIQGDGSKKFLTGTPKQGSSHGLGDFSGDSPIVVGEGYATVASIHEATGWPCVCAFDAGNLAPVARQVRAKHPGRKLVLAGDDDHESGKNKGRELATAAAQEVQAHLAFPKFTESKGRSDFNDMLIEAGATAVRDLLQVSLSVPPPAPPVRNGHGWDFSQANLIENYVLVYGTTTAFDLARHRIIGIQELRAAATRKNVNFWLASSKRRIIEQENVLFDPSCKGDPATTVNLFRGFGMKPVAGTVDKQLQLLFYLCGESDKAYDWVLKWLAYPLQHPGAKMQTALLLHGPEGAGKNLFFRAIREIYGEYGGIIGQSELENRFNGWASAKLFLIGNEIVNRAELYHVKGKLKNMITETEWVIEEKNMPHRYEANHCNFGLFSNVLQPAGLDPDDRRYMIVWTPHPQEAAFYQEVRDEQRNGGVAALYDYLLKLDLEDFSEHTKPIPTDAKLDLIELGMDSHERFFRQWKAGDLPITYMPCMTMDLYRCYRLWCGERGERSVAREVMFSASMRKRIPKLKKKYSFGDSGTPKQAHFFVPPEHQFLDGPTEAAQLGGGVTLFRQQLTDWQTQIKGDKGDRSHE